MTTRVLIVDDAVREIDPVLGWLRQEGYDVTLASRSDQVLPLVEQGQPDLILLSTVMPDNIEVCRWLRRNPGTSSIPVILLTEHRGTEARAECTWAGANDFVTRPPDLGEVRRRLDVLLSPGSRPFDDDQRLLDETCQGALTILPCNLAWLLTTDGNTVRSRTIATDQGTSAAQVFLRLMTEGAVEDIVYSLSADEANPLLDAIKSPGPVINVPVHQLRTTPGANVLFRALNQLRLAYVHFLPLRSAGQLLGMMVLGAKTMYDTTSTRGQQIMTALINQAATVVANARLVADLAAREEEAKIEQAFRKMVLDTMGDGLVVLDDQAVIRYANNRLLRMSGYTRQELYGSSVGLIFHPVGRERLVNSLRRHGRTTSNFSQQLVTKDGQIVPVLMSRATAVKGGTDERSTVLVLTDLTEQKRREQDLERQSERLRLLNRAAQALTSALTLDDVITVLLQSASEIVQCVTACLFLRNQVSVDTFYVIAAIGPHLAPLTGITARLGEGIVGRVAQSHRPQRMSSVPAADTPVGRQIERAGSAVIAVPLRVMDQVNGVLEVVDKVEGQFTQDDVEILENLTAAAAVAVENARLFEQTQRRVSELSTLLEASSAVSSTLDINSIVELIARRLTESLGVMRCRIGSWDRAANQLVMLADVCNAYWPPEQGPIRPILASRFAAEVVQQGKPGFAHLADPDLAPPLGDCLAQVGMSSLLLMPLHFGHTVAGLIELYGDWKREDFTSASLRAAEDSIAHWREQVRKQGSDAWHSRDNLADLYQGLVQACGAKWCAISVRARRDAPLYLLREMGFTLWGESAGTVYDLDACPIMARSLAQGAPTTIQATALGQDLCEYQFLSQAGMPTELLIPLLVRGEASGLIELLDGSATRTFDRAEISLCQGIANVLSSAIENAQLYLSLEKRADALQAAYDELSRADQVKDELIQNLAHELQTPLHQVIMQLNLVCDETYGPLNEVQRENMQDIMRRVAHVGDLVRDMVSLQTLRVQQLQFAQVRLEAVVENAIKIVSPRAMHAGLQIKSTVASDLPPVKADPERIGEVFELLLDNAIKFSPRSERKAERIDIQIDDHGSSVHVAIRDFGIGIPKSEFDRIFQRGYQVDGSITRRFGGTGLGLSLARQIVDAHGGKIWLESTVGAGSQFHFTIPKMDVKFQQS